MAEKVEFYKETKFKDTEIGKIPKEWEVVKLDEVCMKIKAGGTPLTSRKEYYNGNIPFVKIEDMTSSYKYLKSTSATITEAGLKNSNAWLVPVKSLLVAMYGSIGAIAINEIEATTNQAILGILPIEEKTNVEFLFYLLTHLKPLLKKYAKQTTQANLTAEIIKNFKVALPNYFEQQKIAEILSNIDEAIQRINDIIAKTERLKKGLMQELLTRGIGHKEFKDTEIGRIPKEWEVKRISDLFDVITGTTPSTRMEKYWNGGSINWLTPTDLSKLKETIYINHSERKITEVALKETTLTIMPKYSIIISTRAPVGYITVIQEPSTFNQGCKGLIPKRHDGIVPEFYCYYLIGQKQTLENLSGGSTFKELAKETLLNLNIPFPPSKEQQKIAEIISAVNKKLEILKQEKVKLERIKRWFMQELLSGRIRVRVA
jgi:type I restriction enzyme S subunit